MQCDFLILSMMSFAMCSFVFVFQTARTWTKLYFQILIISSGTGPPSPHFVPRVFSFKTKVISSAQTVLFFFYVWELNTMLHGVVVVLICYGLYASKSLTWSVACWISVAYSDWNFLCNRISSCIPPYCHTSFLVATQWHAFELNRNGSVLICMVAA